MRAKKAVPTRPRRVKIDSRRLSLTAPTIRESESDRSGGTLELPATRMRTMGSSTELRGFSASPARLGRRSRSPEKALRVA